MPESTAIISAATSSSSAVPAPSLSPAKTIGSADGRMTLRITLHRLAPNATAARTSSGSASRTPVVGVDRHREEDAEGDHRHLGRLADPEPQDQERQQRDLRDGKGRGDQRRAHAPRRARRSRRRTPDRDAERRRRWRSPRSETLEARRHVHEELAGARPCRRALAQHAERRRQEEHRHPAEPREQLPHDDERRRSGERRAAAGCSRRTRKRGAMRDGDAGDGHGRSSSSADRACDLDERPDALGRVRRRRASPICASTRGRASPICDRRRARARAGATARRPDPPCTPPPGCCG